MSEITVHLNGLAPGSRSRPGPVERACWQDRKTCCSISAVRSVEAASWTNERRERLVAFSFQVRKHLFEYHAAVPSNEAINVFTDDPPRFCFSNDSPHFRPDFDKELQ